MKKLLTFILLGILCSIGNVWGATDEVINAGAWGNNASYTGTCVSAGTYSAGDGGGNIKDYTPSNKGIKLRTKQTSVTVSEVSYGYVLFTVNSGYKVNTFKLEGTSNASDKTVPLKGVYVDVDASDLGTSLASATNQLAEDKVYPTNGTTYISSGALTLNAESNIVLLFDNGSDYNNQLRAILTFSYETTGGGEPSTYDITYDCNGGTSGCPDNVEDQTALPNPLPTPSKTNYSFGGWYTNSSLSSAASAGATLTDDANLYAKWTQSVTFDANTANHGSSGGSATAIYNGTALTSISHATGESGYVLKGYYTAATGGTKVLNANGTFAAADVTGYITSSKWTQTAVETPTLYAQWEEYVPGEFYYLFTPNDASVSPAHSGVKSGQFYCQQDTIRSSQTIDGIAFSHYVKVTANTSLSAAWTSQFTGKTTIDYDMKTTSATFTVYAYNGNGSNYGVCMAIVEEGEEPTSFSQVGESFNKSGQKITFDVTATKNKRVRIGNNSYGNVLFYQIIVEEKGKALPQPGSGKLDYVLDFNKKRFAVKAKGTASLIDGIEIVANSEPKYNGSSAIPKLSNGSNTHTYYIKFTTGSESGYRLKVTASSSFSLNTNASEFAASATASGTETALLPNTTYWIKGKNAEITVSKIEIIAPYDIANVSSLGWCSFASSKPLDLSDLPDGYKAYVVSEVNSTNATLVEVTDIVPAATGLLINGPEGDCTISANYSGATFSGTNKLVGTTSAITGDALTALSNPYVLGKVNDEAALCKFTGTTIPANKAYLPSSEVPSLGGGAPGIRFVIANENNTTDIDAIEATDKTVKFFENGNLYIKRDGVIYDITGRIVK